MKALLLVAHGTEEMEAVISSDVLHRAGIHVTRASVGVGAGEPVECANGLRLYAEEKFEEVYDAGRALEFDVLVLPGGSKGTQTFCTVLRGKKGILGALSFCCLGPSSAAGFEGLCRVKEGPSSRRYLRSPHGSLEGCDLSGGKCHQLSGL
jgi:hypothetical protein